MPKPVLPSHDSASYELLSLTALCGEFPCDSAARFIDSESYRKKIVTGLTHNRLLRIFSRNHLRGYRLGIRGKRLLQDQEPERFLFYLSGCHKGLSATFRISDDWRVVHSETSLCSVQRDGFHSDL